MTSSAALQPSDQDGGIALDASDEPADDLALRRQDPRYVRLMAATRRAARQGYDGVSMRELASTTKMSLATIYAFCPSKDQLIAEAHAHRMERFRTRLDESPPEGRTAEERVQAVAQGMVDALDERNVLGERVLGLPPEPRADAGQTWSETRRAQPTTQETT